MYFSCYRILFHPDNPWQMLDSHIVSAELQRLHLLWRKCFHWKKAPIRRFRKKPKAQRPRSEGGGQVQRSCLSCVLVCDWQRTNWSKTMKGWSGTSNNGLKWISILVFFFRVHFQCMLFGPFLVSKWCLCVLFVAVFKPEHTTERLPGGEKNVKTESNSECAALEFFSADTMRLSTRRFPLEHW